MDEIQRRRGIHASPAQKKKLTEFIVAHPHLIACKVTHDFNYKDSRRLWEGLAQECNALPGARKSWKQWRKTWQDLRSKTKKKQTFVPMAETTLTAAEQEALGINSESYQESEFIPLEQDGTQDNLNNEVESNGSMSEPESPLEHKVFTRSVSKLSKNNVKHKSNSKHSNCFFNCDMLAVHEQRKVQIKEEYLNFKKDYLRQKLKLMKEQTEALKTIAKEMSEFK